MLFPKLSNRMPASGPSPRSKKTAYGCLTVFGFIAIGISAILAITYVLHSNSYCIGQRRFVSDQEMIDAAIEDVMIPINNHARHRSGRNPGERYLGYRDIIEFKEVNPICCRIMTGDEERIHVRPMYNSLDRAFGAYSVVVEVVFKIRYENERGEKLEKVEKSISPVSACGKVVLENMTGG